MTQQPIAFVGGFIVGVLDLNIKEDPLRTWVATEAGTTEAGTQV